MKDQRQLAALDEIEREFENVRSAWACALQRGQWEYLLEALRPLSFFMGVARVFSRPLPSCSG